MRRILIDGKSLTLAEIAEVAYGASGGIEVRLSPAAERKVSRAREFINGRARGDEAIYGVNTGFGSLSKVRIRKDQLKELQVNLIRSHAVGIGRPLSIPETRAAILLRANTLAQGNSGVSLGLLEALLNMLNRGVHPWIPEQGSVGACGDLAPLAHLALVLIGEGQAFARDGRLVDGGRALRQAHLTPYKLQAKEGLSLINGTQIMTAIGALAFLKAEELSRLADTAGALTIEALCGSKAPFDADIHRARPHRGQIEVAKNLSKLLADSEIMASHGDCDRVQDPYSLRCIPQVHGVARDTLRSVRKVLEIEVNSVTDNPLVFAGGRRPKIVNGGNFHGEYVGNAMDQMAIVVAELASISERRIEKLINPSFSDLPAFLVKESGLNSGFMIVQVAAASLVSENKILCHPATVDSIPTSADKEDHVSMGTIAARKARAVVENAWNVLAMEILAAVQGLEFRKPLRPARRLQRVCRAVRNEVSFIEKDRAFYKDIGAVAGLMDAGKLAV